MKARIPKNNFSGGANNLQQIAMQAQKMQKKMDEVGAELDEKEYSATSGGQAVKVTVKGTMEILNIELSNDIIDPDEPDMLCDLIIAAANEALRTAQQDRNDQMEALSGGISIPGLF
ncbi:MAG: YbaB/EbfC family nucleoid-associated protein [Clostridia bacterium]|nr:YbaB/EbfC family nucleoid-associated protein [Clostridia bacterium]